MLGQAYSTPIVARHHLRFYGASALSFVYVRAFTKLRGRDLSIDSPPPIPTERWSTLPRDATLPGHETTLSFSPRDASFLFSPLLAVPFPELAPHLRAVSRSRGPPCFRLVGRFAFRALFEPRLIVGRLGDLGYSVVDIPDRVSSKWSNPPRILSRTMWIRWTCKRFRTMNILNSVKNDRKVERKIEKTASHPLILDFLRHVLKSSRLISLT